MSVRNWKVEWVYGGRCGKWEVGDEAFRLWCEVGVRKKTTVILLSILVNARA